VKLSKQQVVATKQQQQVAATKQQQQVAATKQEKQQQVALVVVVLPLEDPQ
jgi:hypothetical protein